MKTWATRGANVAKPVYDDAGVGPRWVIAANGRRLGSRQNATVYPDRLAAGVDASLWKTPSTVAFSVIVEPLSVA